MDKQQARQLIKETFTQPFDRDRFGKFAANLLNHVDGEKAFRQTLIKEAYRAGISHYERLGTYTDPDGEEIDGTALAIVNHPRVEHLGKGLFIDVNPEIVDTLNSRFTALRGAGRATAYRGDYTDATSIAQTLDALPSQCLNLVFVDPTDCSVPFATVKTVFETVKNADLLINVSIGTDVSRNIARVVLDPSFCRTRERYAAFLGDDAFFSRSDVVEAASAGQVDRLRQLFAEEYKARLAEHGFVYTDLQPIRHYYYLLFASRSRKGLEFWREACTYSPSGQKEMNLGL